MAHHNDGSMQECIDRCQSCQESCLRTVSHCLSKGGMHAEASHIQMLLACAEICDTSARFMLLESTHHGRTCDVCAEVCSACADECARFGDDEAMQQCAETCRKCAESCQRMAAATA